MAATRTLSVRRLLLVGVLTVVALVGFAAPASAHASLTSSTPANGARLDSPPRAVVLQFSEPVEVALGGVRVFDRAGDRVDRGRITHPGDAGTRVSVALPRLREGGYVVTWRVVSADSHPVQGAFSFVIGDAAPASAGAVAELLDARGGSSAVGVLYGVSRALAFASLLILLGSVAFVLWFWPAGTDDARFHRITRVSLVVLAVTSAANFVLQGLYAAGLGLGSVADPAVLGDVAATRFGRVYLVRFALLVVAAIVLPRVARWRWAALVVGAGVAATPAFAGHAAIGSHEPYALIADVVHVAAAAVWIGAIVMLVGVVLVKAGFDEATAVTTRFSTAAPYVVFVVVATGLFQGYRQVGSADALRTTEYGKLLAVKALLVGAVLCVAYISRYLLRKRWAPRTVAMLRRSVLAEAALVVGVLSVTSLLVNAVPAKVIAAAPQSGELSSETMLLDFTVSPGRAGANNIHLYSLTKVGQPRDVIEMTLSLGQQTRGISPINVRLEKAGIGHFQAIGFDIPFPGKWTMVVTARTSEIDSEVFEGEVQIR